MSGTHENLMGQVFGRLTVIAGPTHKRGRTAWMCLCSCSKRNSFIVCSKELKMGQSTSCGCIKDELHRVRLATHGMSETPEYRAWQLIKNRCGNPKAREYLYYGGRGIKLYDAWQTSFVLFHTHLGPRPSPLHSVDRHPDMNGDYAPGNVRWATSKEQNRNRRNNVLIVVGGRTITLAQAAEEAGLPYGLVYRRFVRDKFTPELTLKPPGRK